MNSDGGGCVELIEGDNYDVGMYSLGTDVDDLDGVRICLIEHTAEYKEKFMQQMFSNIQH